jgi:hypothetical protein
MQPGEQNARRYCTSLGIDPDWIIVERRLLGDERLEFINRRLPQPRFVIGERVTLGGRPATIAGPPINPIFDRWQMTTAWAYIREMEPEYAVVFDDTKELVIVKEHYLDEER